VTTTTEADLAAAGEAPRGHVHPNLALTIIAAAQLMVVLDATIVNIALPSIHHALNFSTTGLSWVLNAYTLVFGGLLLLGGRTGDLFGKRRMFIVGVLLFSGASLAAGFAQDKGFLLAMRALQGVGGAIASPTALSLVTSTFPQGPERNRAFGVYAAVSGAGAAIGLIMGGILTDLLSWRWVFFVNAPIGIALALAAPYVIAETERRKTADLDLPGAITSTLGMFALVFGLIHAASYTWGSVTAILSFVAAVILLTAFVFIEARTPNPLLPLRLFANRARVGSYIVMLVLGAGVFAMFYFLTQFVQQVLGYSPLKAGFAFLPISVVIVIMSQVASRIITRLGPQILIVSGTIITGFGLLYLSRISETSSYLGGILPAIILIGTGMGFIFVPVTLTAVGGAAPQDAGIASAMLNVTQQIGGTLGLSALVTVFSAAVTNYAHDHHVSVHGSALAAGKFTAGADSAFRVSAIFVAIGLVAALTLIRIPAGQAPSDVSEVPTG
jgi:EmrB/QacA subfamily drug resistance transporter